MNIKDEHTSRLWTFIMKGEIMAFELDESELIATRINNKAASWKEVEEYIEKYYVRKDKIKKLDRENQALFESINCDDKNMLERLYKEEKEKNKELEEYANWHIKHLTEDIADYIDDDRNLNRSLIGELKEEREHWKDINRIINNEKTYIDYKNY